MKRLIFEHCSLGMRDDFEAMMSRVGEPLLAI